MRKITITILLLCCALPSSAQSVTYRPALEASTECATAQDKFLCMALRKGAELLEQQINCEVIQSYTQKAWDGRTLTKTPDSYYVRVRKGEEVFYKINNAGKLAHPTSRPAYQAVEIYSVASWYTTQAAIFKNGRFFDKREIGGGVGYSYFVPGSFTLTSGSTRVAVDVSGEIEFDKAGLLRRIYLKHKMLPDQMKRHKFKSSEEETIFDNPKGFEEVQPVPVEFWSKMATTYGDKVVIEATYRDYKRFETDVVFGDALEDVKSNARRRIDGKRFP